MEQQLTSTLGILLAIWIMAIGLGVMVRGARGAQAVFAWPIRFLWRTLRWAVGGFLVWVGNGIRGGGGRRERH